MGGSILNPVKIDPDNTLQRRSGLKSISQFFTGKNKATLIVQMSPVLDLELEQRRSLDYIPYSLITSTYSLPYIALYRICINDDYSNSNNENSIYILYYSYYKYNN